MNRKKELHKQAIQLAHQRNKLTNQLMAMLPEMFELKIHLDHGCATIEEYCGKYLGLSNGVVKKRINLEKHLEGKPKLKEAIKTQGLHKVALVATIATPLTDQHWADKVENMSKAATQKLVKEVRNNENNIEPTACNAEQKVTIDLDQETQKLFFKLKEKLAKNTNNKQALKIILKEISKEEPKPKTRKTSPRGEATRHIPAATKRELENRSNGTCEYPSCTEAAQLQHHHDPFSKSKSHETLVHLCKSHHEFAHNGLIQGNNPANWQLSLTGQLTDVDKLYRKYRKNEIPLLSLTQSSKK